MYCEYKRFCKAAKMFLQSGSPYIIQTTIIIVHHYSHNDLRSILNMELLSKGSSSLSNGEGRGEVELRTRSLPAQG